MSNLTRPKTYLVRHKDDNLETYIVNTSRWVTPESFGCSTSADDNTYSVIAALNSEQVVVWQRDKVYPVKSEINVTQESWSTNKGVMKLDTTRHSLGEVTVNFEESVSETDPIRGIYVESAYDLCELAYMKGLGINTILHYGNFNVAGDTGGNVDYVYDACQLLGLRVIANTEVRDVKDPSLGLVDFVQKYNSHPAIYAWAAQDEAMSRHVSVQDQKSWVDSIRSVSNKPVTMVDAWLQLDPITPALYDGYDIVFADPYPQRYDSGTLGERVEKDMTRIRRAFYFIKAHSKCKRVIPVLGLCLAAQGSSGPGSRDEDQNVAVAERYVVAGNGEFVSFVWDGKGDPANGMSVRDSSKFRNMLRGACARIGRAKVEGEVFLVGGNQNSGHYPLGELISRVPSTDPSTLGDTWKQSNAWPVHCIGSDSAAESDRVMQGAGWNQSGLGFKGTNATFCTDIPFRKYVAMHGFINTSLSSVQGSMTLAGTYDGGYNVIGRNSVSIGATSYEWVAVEATQVNPEETVAIINTCSVESGYYRRWFQGIIISSGW